MFNLAVDLSIISHLVVPIYLLFLGLEISVDQGLVVVNVNI